MYLFLYLIGEEMSKIFHTVENLRGVPEDKGGHESTLSYIKQRNIPYFVYYYY